MSKQHILEEIKRTAMTNGGVPLGVRKFATETGIREHEVGRYWARWGDAVREAGFTPNQKVEAYDEEGLILKLIELARELGRFPVKSEISLRSRSDPDFPSPRPFRRLGSKSELVSLVEKYCREHVGFEDALSLCESVVQSKEPPPATSRENTENLGFVYLLKSGRFYKIGRSNSAGRRHRELAIQLPEKANCLHSIRTDDPAGIEAYWHKRFESKRKNGEWFDLSASDVSAFKRRKFM